MADNQKSALKPRNSTKPHTDKRDNKKRFSHHANTYKKATAQGSASRAAAALCVNAIEEGNILYLKKFPKIGDKVARQIILDLKGKLVETSNDNVVNREELIDALQALGYKNSDINKVIKNVDKTASIENQIKEALKLMLK